MIFILAVSLQLLQVLLGVKFKGIVMVCAFLKPTTFGYQSRVTVLHIYI